MQYWFARELFIKQCLQTEVFDLFVILTVHIRASDQPFPWCVRVSGNSSFK